MYFNVYDSKYSLICIKMIIILIILIIINLFNNILVINIKLNVSLLHYLKRTLIHYTENKLT